MIGDSFGPGPRPSATVPGAEPHRELIDGVLERTRRIVDRLRRLGDDELRQPSELPGWSRLTIACHLRYGADALIRMTRGALAGQAVAYYPEGREVQRPQTLVPLAGEPPALVVESLAHRSEELHRVWSALGDDVGRVDVVEPAGNRDLGPVSLGRLVLLRLTEVEVHGADLGVGVGEWSELFVTSVLPMRLEWLNARRANHRDFDTDLRGSWLLVATDGPAYRVSVDGLGVASRPAARDAPVDAVIEATSRDLLALLLGRPLRTPPTVTGDVDFGRSFSSAFPGP